MSAARVLVGLSSAAILAGAPPGPPICEPGACDAACVDEGRYQVTREIVHDTRDPALWQRRVTVELPQPEADAYCKHLVVEGLGGWRLPTTRELSSIRYKPGGLFGGGARRHYCIPSIDQAAFPDTPADLFWTTVTRPDGTAWYVGFDDGRAHRDVIESEHWVRCVRDPE